MHRVASTPPACRRPPRGARRGGTTLTRTAYGDSRSSTYGVGHGTAGRTAQRYTCVYESSRINSVDKAVGLLLNGIAANRTRILQHTLQLSVHARRARQNRFRAQLVWSSVHVRHDASRLLDE